jgi:hypothetical protein
VGIQEISETHSITFIEQLLWNNRMRTLISILTLIVSISYSSQIPVEFNVPKEEPTIEPFKATVLAKILYIREKPNDRSPIIGSLRWGDIIYLETGSGFRTKPDGEEKYHQWFKISERYSNGWVWGGYIKVNIKSVRDSTLYKVIANYIPDAQFQTEKDLSLKRVLGVGFTGPIFLIDLNYDNQKELVVPIYDVNRSYILILKYPSLNIEKSFIDIGVYYKIARYLSNLLF